MSGFRISSETDSTGITVEMKVIWEEDRFDVDMIEKKATSVLASAFVELDRRDKASAADSGS